MIFAGALAVGDVRAADLPPLRSTGSPQFSADVVVSLHADGRPALGIAFSLPYTQLQWIRATQGYAAAAQFTVVFEPVHGSRQVGDVWDRSLLVPDFRSTTAPAVAVLERRTFEVPPGKYRIRTEIEDLNSELRSTATDVIEVPDYSKIQLGLAELELGVEDPIQGFHPVPSRRYGLEVSRIAARVAVFDRHSGGWPRTHVVKYRLLDEGGTAVATGSREIQLERENQTVIVRPDSTALFLGSYSFELEIGEGKSRTRVDRTFEVEDSGPPRGKEFDRMLEPLSYIAEAKDVDKMRKLPPDQQARAWEEFWRRRDPTPDTPRNEAMLEFIRRVRYAERHFQNFGPGWLSDMGRIYIKYGPPDQVESRPATSSSLPVEIWYYNRPYRRFVFVDREGFGRYVITGASDES